MDASCSVVAANAMVDPRSVAATRIFEAKAVGFINSVKGAVHLGLCLLGACETGHPTCTKLLLAAHAASTTIGGAAMAHGARRRRRSSCPR